LEQLTAVVAEVLEQSLLELAGLVVAETVQQEPQVKQETQEPQIEEEAVEELPSTLAVLQE
jgi:hypothetical protein